MRIAPGEPVPPGFEDEVKVVAQLKSTIDKHRNYALLGLEYIAELVMSDAFPPTYYCILCQEHCSTTTSIMFHIKAYPHRVTYLKRHFPAAIKPITLYLSRSNAEGILTAPIDRLCLAIEDYHGRLTPTVYQKDDFNQNHNKYVDKVKSGRHIAEQKGILFANIMDVNAIAKNFASALFFPPEKRPNITRQSMPDKHSSRLTNSSKKPRFETITTPVEERNCWDAISSNEEDNLRSRDRPVKGSSTKPRSLDSISSDGHSSLTKKTSSQSEAVYGKDPEADYLIYQKYLSLVDDAISHLKTTLKEFEKYPQKHPKYPSEWNIFWKRRSEQLEAENQDPYEHNFSTEWTKFWINRMQELYEEDVAAKKLEIQRKLKLPSNFKPPPPPPITNIISSDIPGKSIFPSANTLGATEQSPGPDDSVKPYSVARSSSSVHIIDSSDDEQINSCDYYRGRHSPYNTPYDDRKRRRSPPIGKSKMPVSNLDKLDMISDEELDIDDDDHDDVNYESLTVISVLRILTAFEDILGSLGPKVVDLLSKAVALEKVKANLADELLMSSDNSVLLDTVKEKLKGLILAGMVERFKVRAVRKAIRNVNGIVKVIDKKTKEKELTARQQASQPAKREGAEKPATNRNPIDLRLDIIKQLETSLMLQGRHVTQEQLHRMADLYTSSNSGKTAYMFGLEMGAKLGEMDRMKQPMDSINNVTSSKVSSIQMGYAGNQIQQQFNDDSNQKRSFGQRASHNQFQTNYGNNKFQRNDQPGSSYISSQMQTPGFSSINTSAGVKNQPIHQKQPNRSQEWNQFNQIPNNDTMNNSGQIEQPYFQQNPQQQQSNMTQNFQQNNNIKPLISAWDNPAMQSQQQQPFNFAQQPWEQQSATQTKNFNMNQLPAKQQNQGQQQNIQQWGQQQRQGSNNQNPSRNPRMNQPQNNKGQNTGKGGKSNRRRGRGQWKNNNK